MKEIPLRSRDLIDMLEETHKPKIISVNQLTTEQSRLELAVEQGRIELVQQLKRQLDKQEAING